MNVSFIYSHLNDTNVCKQMYTCMRMEIIQHQYLCTIERTFLVREIVNNKKIKNKNNVGDPDFCLI